MLSECKILVQTSLQSHLLDINLSNINTFLLAILTKPLLGPDELVPNTTKTPRQFARTGLIQFEPTENPSLGRLTALPMWFSVVAATSFENEKPIFGPWGLYDYGDE